MTNNYIFKNFKNNSVYKRKLLEVVKKMCNLEIGGYRFYDGSGTHYMQNPKEIVELVFNLKNYEKKKKIKLKSFLEIGFAAGTNNSFLNKFFEFQKIVAIDHVSPGGINKDTFFSNLRFKNLTLICGDSTKKETIEHASILGPYDFIFIDGGHSYEIVKKDFQNYSKMLNKNGLIAMHDIFSDTDVPKLWKELKKKHNKDCKFSEFYDPSQELKYGIGLIYKN
jgi:hypothetical protein